jgi:hypothetical protein
VRTVALSSGYPESIINVETISPTLAPLGYGKKGSIFFLGHRVAVPEDEAALELYLKAPPYQVFRVTPKVKLASVPEPIPVLRVRGTGHTEMDLYPALKRLRQAILDKEQKSNWTTQEMDSQIWQYVLPTGQITLIEKPWVALQRGIFTWAATRDTNYIQTIPYFKLREGIDEYVIAYGVNHAKTGKATYSNLSVIAEPMDRLYSGSGREHYYGREFGVATIPNRDFGDSARKYLPDDPEADLLYAIKVARSCGPKGHKEEYCLEVKPPNQVDISGQPYVCDPLIDLDKADMYIVFRAYMEPSTKVGPDDNELLWDRGIYFTPE